MTTIVYYDLSEIGERDVARATAGVAGEVLHVHAADTPVPATVLEPRHAVPSMRDASTRSDTMDQLWKLIGVLPEPTYRGVDLREATRYTLLFATERYFHQAWVLTHLQSKFAGEILWYTDSPDNAATMRAVADKTGIALRVQQSAPSSAKRMFRRPLDALRLRGWMLRRHFNERRWSLRRSVDGRLYAPDKVPIVFAEYYPNSAHVSMSIARRLREASNLQPVFVSQRLEVAHAAESAGMSNALLRQFPKRGKPEPDWLVLERAWSDQLHELAAQPIRFEPEGPDCRDILLPSLFAEVKRAFAEAAEVVDEAHAMIDHLPPTLLVTTSSGSTFGRTMAATAKARGVPTAWVQHGLLLDEPAMIHIAYDSMLVWGESDRRRLLQSDAKGTIQVVGAPIYDALVKQAREASTEPTPLRERPVVNVLYLASRTAGAVVGRATAERLLHTVMSVVARIPNALLTIKVHPGDHTGMAQRAVGDSVNVNVAQSGSSQEWILKSDIAIVTSSTTGLEVCVVQRPLISLTFEGMTEGVDYAGYGAALCVQTELELEDALNRLMNEVDAVALRAGQRRLVDDMLDGATGDAIGKSATLLLQLAQNVPQSPRKDKGCAHRRHSLQPQNNLMSESMQVDAAPRSVCS